MENSQTLYVAPLYKRIGWQLNRFAPFALAGLIIGFFIWLPNDMSVTVTLGGKTQPRTADTLHRSTVLGLPLIATTETVTLADIPEPPKPKTYFVFTDFVPVTDKDDATVAYLRKFYRTAQEEAEKYGQPASVKLAQALVESDRGESYLVQKANNHFGVKCFSKTCKKGHCVNRQDDSHKDYFKVYADARDSFRQHSIFLQKKRYADCFDTDEWATWCDCLKKNGYATDPKYARTLKSVIRKFRLYEFDE